MNLKSLHFDHQVAVVTGAGRGLGRAIALCLAARGASVVVNDFGCDLSGNAGGDAAPAQSVVNEIIANGGKAVAVMADIGSTEGVAVTLKAAFEHFGGLHIIVHNASPVMPMTSFEDATREGFDVSLRVNTVAAWELAKQSWMHFKDQGFGRIVLINSAAGLFGRSGMPAYSLVKSSMSGFAKYLAHEGQAFGIRVNCVAPVAHTRAWEGQNVPAGLEALMPPSHVAEVVALLSHACCPTNGELFHSAGVHLSRVFVGQTEGACFASADFCAEQILDELDAVLSTQSFDIPAHADESGAVMVGRLMARAGASS